MRRIAIVSVVLGLVACGTEEETGSADLALTGQAPSGRVFRLRDGVLDLLGDGVAQTFRTEDDPTRTSILAPLRAGEYRLTLSPGWRLEEVGTPPQVVAADLVSPNPLPFSIEDGVTSPVRLRFAVEGEDVPMTGGAADIGVAIEERDAGAPDGGAPPDAPPSTISIYVSPLGVDTDPGTSPDRPVLHVQVAIDRAALCVPAPCDVRIAQGTYVETISLASGVSVTGGYRGDFGARDPRLYPVVLTSLGSQAVAARGLRAETRLEDVTVRGADLSADTTGASSYGLQVADSAAWLSLRRVRVELGRGGRGRDGDPGGATTCAVAGGEGGSGFDCGARAGLPGAPGDTATGGAGGGPGTSTCAPTSCPLFPSSTRGLNGVVGAEGLVGGAGVPTTDADGSFVADRWQGALGVAGARGGHGGGGGGGGAGGAASFAGCSTPCPTLLGGHGGAGGAGGCGGGGGVSGGAGGGAFGIVIAGSSVVADRVDVIGGAGGTGGRGGDGRVGAEGSVSDAGWQDGQVSSCSVFGSSGAGGRGARGGRGGRGGGGPGGIGGPVIGTGLVNGGLLLGLPGSVTYAIGTAGGGGAGGTGFDNAPGGVSGVAAERVTY